MKYYVICVKLKRDGIRSQERNVSTLVEASIVEQIRVRKWTALIGFFVMDVVQILFVSVLTINESSPFAIEFGANALVSGSLFASITLVQLIMIYIMALNMMRSPNMIQLYPDFVTPATWSCKFSRDDIVEWTMEMANKSDIRVNKIFLMKSPMPNAFTFCLPIIGSFVVLHSNLLDVLRPDEVKAIIAHEVGHIRNKDSLVQILVRMPSFFVDIIYLYIYARLALSIANAFVAGELLAVAFRTAVLLSFFGLSRLLMMVSHLLMQKASREAELLSDYHAANTVGVELTVNALIRLGQRIEALSALIDEIGWLESLNPERERSVPQPELIRMITQYPLDGIDDENAKERAPWIFLSTRLKHMRDVYGIQLTDEQIESAVFPAMDFLKKKRAESKSIEELDQEKRKPAWTIDWRSVDYDGDRRLSKDELHELLELLRKNPSKLMFTNEVGMNLLAVDHPDFRRRILTIAKAFAL